MRQNDCSERYSQGNKGKVVKLKKLVNFVRSWRLYDANMRELSGLNDRELADIGISRSDIPRIAKQHARS